MNEYGIEKMLLERNIFFMSIHSYIKYIGTYLYQKCVLGLIQNYSTLVNGEVILLSGFINCG